ncbi:MAG: PAS domain S-box protein [Deltaproteobacteria bacterium]|nr:PAS domain S-box protein [Deltaproteobacteria bacterium]
MSLFLMLGYYLDVQSDAMNDRHLEVSIELERMIRLDQELTSMLSLAVVEHNALRTTSYDTVRHDIEAAIMKVADLTKGQSITQEISALSEGFKEISGFEETALQLMRSDRWKEAGDILFGDAYLRVKKTHEIDSEAIPGIVRGEIETIEKRFNRIKSAALIARIAALCLLLWTGIMFSRRTRADLAEQVRLRTEISVAKEALEARVLERTEELRLLLHSAGEGIFGMDTAGRVTFINPAALNMLGYVETEITGKSAHDLIHHSHADGSPYPEKDCLMNASFTSAAINRVTDEVLWRKDRSSFPVEYSSTPIAKDGRIMGAVVSFRDITERKQMEQKIIAEGERLKNILYTAPINIAFSTKGKIHFANPLFVDTFGAKAGDASPQLYVHPEERDALVERLKRDGIVKDVEIKMFNSRKQARDMLITYMPINYEGEDGILGWLMDFTERKQSEEALKEHMEDLERFSRLTIDREERMIQLKEEINMLLEQMGREKKYTIVVE